MTPTSEPPKLELPPIRTFKVRRDNPEWIVPPPGRCAYDYNRATTFRYVEEGIEAHRFEFTSHGDIVFQRFVGAFATANGPAYDYRTVKIIASGTWYDAEEVSELFVTSSVN